MSITYVMETGTVVVRATAAETGGAYSIVEYTAQPGHSRSRHIHRNVVEAFLVLEGEGTFEVGERLVTAGPGEYIAVARGVPHNVFNRTDAPARWLEIYSPAGFEAYLIEMAEAALANDGRIPAEVRADIVARHDIERV